MVAPHFQTGDGPGGFQLTIPPAFETIMENKDHKKFLLKVDESLDWRTALTGARILIENGVPQVHRSSTPLGAKVLADSWNQFVPLQPAAQGSSTLVVGKGIDTALHLSPTNEQLAAVDSEVKAKQDAAAAAQKRRAAGDAQHRAVEHAATKQSMRRFKVASIADALKGVGFDVGNAQQFQDTEESAAGESKEDECWHLKPLQEEESRGLSVPIAFWGIGPFPKDGKKGLQMKALAGKGRSTGPSLRGQVQGAGAQEFEGKLLKRKRQGFRYIIGVQSPGSKKVFLEEADVFHVHLKGHESLTPVDTINYAAKRNQVVSELGTVKKLRQHTRQEKKKNAEHTVASFGGYAEEAKERAEVLKAKRVSTSERDLEVKRAILPPYNEKATDPSQVYREGLRFIAPPAMLSRETALVERGLIDFFMMQPREQYVEAKTLANKANLKAIAQQKVDMGPFGSQLALAVAMVRASCGIMCKDKEEAQKLARQFGVLNCLWMLAVRGTRHKHGKCVAPAVAELVGLPGESALAAHWHSTYYNEVLGQSSVRAIDVRKTQCALMVWMLHLTPKCAIDIPSAVDREMALGPGSLKKCFEYIGCQVTEERENAHTDVGAISGGKKLAVKLAGPPQMNVLHYMKQEGQKPTKGKGKGKNTEEQAAAGEEGAPAAKKARK